MLYTLPARRTTCNNAPPRLTAKRRYLLLLGLLLVTSQAAWAQLQASISSTTLGANVCGPRTINATVSGGSGDYSYFWNARPNSSSNLGANSSITVEPTVTTTYSVAVYDNNTGNYAPPVSVSVFPAVSGEPLVTIPNVFTPNGDGVNDRWEVRGLYGAAGTFIKAYRWHLEIYPRNRPVFYQSDYTDTNPGNGIVGGQIFWDGQGAVDGTYYYYLTLYNCTYPNGKLYSGQLDIFGSSARRMETTSEELAIYPNPAANTLTVNPSMLLSAKETTSPQVKQAVARTAAGSVVQGTYEVKLVDKFNRVQRTVLSPGAAVELDVKDLPEGTYFLTVKQGEMTTRKQIVVTH